MSFLEPMTYSGDHDHLLAHEPQRLAPPLTSFEYQGDFSSQLTEVAGKILFYGNFRKICSGQPDK